MRRLEIEPESTAWKATMLTFTPPTLVEHNDHIAKKEAEIRIRQLNRA